MKKKHGRGRPTSLNAKLQKEICGLLAKGSSIKSACIQCGIGERSYHDWNERGKTGEEPEAMRRRQESSPHEEKSNE